MVINTHSTPKFLAGNYASGTEDKLFYNYSEWLKVTRFYNVVQHYLLAR